MTFIRASEVVSKSEKTPRLWSPGRVLGYKRSRQNQHPNHVLIRIDGVQTRKDTTYYRGKRVAYIYKVRAKKPSGSPFKVVWGKVTGAHGNSGVVRAKFNKNLSADSFASRVRVYMYPSSI